MFIINLCGSGLYRGKIIHGKKDTEYGPNTILVLPNASEEYYTTMAYSARKNNGNLCIIVERGGSGAHLIVSANEKNISGTSSISVCMMPNALTLLKEGDEVVVSTFDHNITII